MLAAEQLNFDMGAESLASQNDIDLVEAMIVADGGDPRRAVYELMLDADFLRGQLSTSARLMSNGYTRGWRPKYERI